MLIELANPVNGAKYPSPSPNPTPQPAAVDPAVIVTTPSPLPSPSPLNRDVTEIFNVMRLNNNTAFAMDNESPRYLRVKGFGLNEDLDNNEQPLSFKSRGLTFADLRTSPCDDNFGTDSGRRLCTKKDDDCGPCFGDTGSPLYDVDKSGKVSVLVGMVTFGVGDVDTSNPVCTGERPVVYTAIAPHVDWIVSEVGADAVSLFSIPKEGITNTNLAREESTLAIFARTSAIVIPTLALLGAIIAVIVTWYVRRIRKKRKRWVEGLHAEDSFVKGNEKDANLEDPFEGIQDDQRGPRLSISGLSRAAVKGATEFSARSMGALRALLAAAEEEDDTFEPRDNLEGAPVWLSPAWERLFIAPSKKELEHLHKVPTQRIVDDVLEGGDKTVEPSLEEAAFKAVRDEANLDAAWHKLELQTSLRNISEASEGNLTPGLTSPPLSPRALSRFTSRNSSRNTSREASRNASRNVSRGVSRNASRNNSIRVMSPASPRRGGSGRNFSGKTRFPGDLTKADTLLAAFATIDAESEQVAEETVIDSSALQALAMAKRPNVLDALRKKFSNGGSARSNRSDRGNVDDDGTGRFGASSKDVRRFAEQGSPSDGAGRISRQTSGGAFFATNQLPSGKSSVRVLTTAAGPSGALSAAGSRHSSMRIDYFSEDYSMSESSSDEEGDALFEQAILSGNRRYTEDRRADGEEHGRLASAVRGLRKGPARSFEKLGKLANSNKRSLGNRTVTNDDEVTEVDFGDTDVTGVFETVEEEHFPDSHLLSAVPGRVSMEPDRQYGIDSVAEGKRPRREEHEQTSISRAFGGMAGGPTQLRDRQDNSFGGSASGSASGVGSSSHMTEGDPNSSSGDSVEGDDDEGSVYEVVDGRVAGVNQLNVAMLKQMWNDMASRDSAKERRR